ncbi:hypothetical protein TMatcc_009860 [Talaromyces marneffei ATCC 18224]
MSDLPVAYEISKEAPRHLEPPLTYPVGLLLHRRRALADADSYTMYDDAMTGPTQYIFILCSSAYYLANTSDSRRATN